MRKVRGPALRAGLAAAAAAMVILVLVVAVFDGLMSGVETLSIVLGWLAVVGIVSAVGRSKGVLVLWALLAALWVWIPAGLRSSEAPWYIRLLLGAPEWFLVWSLFALPLAAATEGFVREGALDRRGLASIAIAALAWTGLFAVAAWVASYASDVGGANPRHLPIVLWGFGAAWLLWPVAAVVWGARRSRAG